MHSGVRGWFYKRGIFRVDSLGQDLYDTVSVLSVSSRRIHRQRRIAFYE